MTAGGAAPGTRWDTGAAAALGAALGTGCRRLRAPPRRRTARPAPGPRRGRPGLAALRPRRRPAARRSRRRRRPPLRRRRPRPGPARPQRGAALRRDRAARPHRDDAAEPRHVGHLPHARPRLRRPQPRRAGEAPLLYACLLLSNAGSLLLPGSNLTNLIVLGHLHLSGRCLLRPHGAAGAGGRRRDRARRRRRATTAPCAPPPSRPTEPERPVLGVGLVADRRRHRARRGAARAGAARWPPSGVAAVLLALVAQRWRRRGRPRPGRAGRCGPRRPRPGRALRPRRGAGHARALLVGPRHPALPPRRLGHRAVPPLTSVLVNNLPAASLLAARQPPHPFALLIGLNVGPNLFVTGSLAWILWLRAATDAGAIPTCGGPACWGWSACRSPLRPRSACWSSAAPAERQPARRTRRQPCMAMWSVRTVTRMRTSPSRRMG